MNSISSPSSDQDRALPPVVPNGVETPGNLNGVPLTDVTEDSESAIHSNTPSLGALISDEVPWVVRNALTFALSNQLSDPVSEVEKYREFTALLEQKEITPRLMVAVRDWATATTAEERKEILVEIRALPGCASKAGERSPEEQAFFESMKLAIEMLQVAQEYAGHFMKSAQDEVSGKKLLLQHRRLEAVNKNIARLEKDAASVLVLASHLLEVKQAAVNAPEELRMMFPTIFQQRLHFYTALKDAFRSAFLGSVDANKDSEKVFFDFRRAHDIAVGAEMNFLSSLYSVNQEMTPRTEMQQRLLWESAARNMKAGERLMGEAIGAEEAGTETSRAHAAALRKVADQYKESGSIYHITAELFPLNTEEKKREGKMWEKAALNANRAAHMLEDAVRAEFQGSSDRGLPPAGLRETAQILKESSGAYRQAARAFQRNTSEKKREGEVWMKVGTITEILLGPIEEAIEAEAQGTEETRARATRWREMALQAKEAVEALRQAAKASGSNMPEKSKEVELWTRVSHIRFGTAYDMEQSLKKEMQTPVASQPYTGSRERVLLRQQAAEKFKLAAIKQSEVAALRNQDVMEGALAALEGLASEVAQLEVEGNVLEAQAEAQEQAEGY